jgi:hypothetical protein
MPAMANPTSIVSRTWTSESPDWQALLVDAVGEADRHGVRWRRLSCHTDSVVASGVKELAVDGEVVLAIVAVSVRGIDAEPSTPLTLKIRFDSRGAETVAGPSTGAGLEAPEDCPFEIPELV